MSRTGWYYVKGAQNVVPDSLGQRSSVIVYVVDDEIVAAQDERTKPDWDTWVAEGTSDAWRSVPYGFMTPLHHPTPRLTEEILRQAFYGVIT